MGSSLYTREGRFLGGGGGSPVSLLARFCKFQSAMLSGSSRARVFASSWALLQSFSRPAPAVSPRERLDSWVANLELLDNLVRPVQRCLGVDRGRRG